MPSSVPDLKLAKLIIDLQHLKAEVHPNCGQVVLDEVVVAVPEEEGGLADALIAHDDYLEKEILLFNHLCFGAVTLLIKS